MSRDRRLAQIVRTQAWYYIVTGIWPLLHRGSFEAVTGRKLDYWLAQTVGALLAATGLVLLSVVRSGRLTREIALLGGSNALVIFVFDVIGARQPLSTPLYLADAVLELAAIAAWIWAWRTRRVGQ
ncbi:MAG TPA: hypothetical protein VK163_15855 [Opitutaceae bacterium]|nr:hypothetical protein [Opitutaceae bacterium]